MGPQGGAEAPAGRIPLGMGPEELPREPGGPEAAPAGTVSEVPSEMKLAEKGRRATVLNTASGSGNTANNPDNNITARTLEGGAGLEP